MDHSLAQKHLISDIKTRVLRVAYELQDDPNYTKEDAIKDLDEIVNILDQVYPR
nr:hypothetical protein 11 [Bacillales bacterium]